MASCGVLILGSLWILCLIKACGGEELSREVVVSWLKEQVLEGLGLEEPPRDTQQGPNVKRHMRIPRTTSRTTGVSRQKRSRKQESSEMILFPSPESSCVTSGPITFTYHFQPSINTQDTVVTSAHFWFYVGEGTNSSAPLFIITSTQQLLQAAEAPAQTSSDGWTTYHVDQTLLGSVAEGPFLLQVHCAVCHCSNKPDKTPFLHLHIHPRGPVRSPRHAEPASIPWSPSAIYLLQRPSQEMPQTNDCHRAGIDISFEELGWDNWIVHPKVLTFYYCHGNCSAGDRTLSVLGVTQCCAPVPGSMRSLKITTTSDGGYSFKYETLPNLMPEECTCI